MTKWLEVIRRDVQGVRVDDHTFWEVQDMFQKNARLRDTPSHFNQWMAFNFTQSAAVRIRRLVDRDRSTISLRRFLDEIKEFPELLSRDAVMRQYRAANTSLPVTILDQMAEREYDRSIGIGVDTPPPEMIAGEIAKLEQATSSIKRFVDRRIAHYDQRELSEDVPKLKNIDTCLTLFFEIIRKYGRLLNGRDYPQELPVILDDWKAIFKFAWDVEI